MIEINGMAHVILAVSEWERCRPFYEALLSFLGLTRVFSGEDSIYYVGGRTAVGVGRCNTEYEGERRWKRKKQASKWDQGQCWAAPRRLRSDHRRDASPSLKRRSAMKIRDVMTRTAHLTSHDDRLR